MKKGKYHFQMNEDCHDQNLRRSKQRNTNGRDLPSNKFLTFSHFQKINTADYRSNFARPFSNRISQYLLANHLQILSNYDTI